MTHAKKINADKFAQNWIKSWNAHDLNDILSHYDDNVEYLSVFVAKLENNDSGMLHGKKQVKNYFKKGLESYPDLHFELENIFVGITSITLQYKSVNNLLAAEVFELNEKGLVKRVQCHYKAL